GASQILPTSPHEQPPAMQRSALPAAQGAQAPPPVAQPLCGDGARQLSPMQQPFGQWAAQGEKRSSPPDGTPPSSLNAACELPAQPATSPAIATIPRELRQVDIIHSTHRCPGPS